MDHILEDLVCFSNSTWLIVLGMFTLHAILAYAIPPSYLGHLPGVEFQLLVMGLVLPVASCFFMWQINKGISRIIQQGSNNDFRVTRSKVGELLDVELYISRVMQALLFVICYCTTRLVASVRFWKGQYDITGDHPAVISGLYLAAWALLLFVCGSQLLPNILIGSTLFYALPPTVDDVNKAALVACSKHPKWEADKCPEGVLDQDWSDGIGQDAKVFGLTGLKTSAKVTPQETAHEAEQ